MPAPRGGDTSGLPAPGGPRGHLPLSQADFPASPAWAVCCCSLRATAGGLFHSNSLRWLPGKGIFILALAPGRTPPLLFRPPPPKLRRSLQGPGPGMDRDALLCLPRPASSTSASPRPGPSPAVPPSLPFPAGALGMSLFPPEPGVWQGLAASSVSQLGAGLSRDTGSHQPPSGRHSGHPARPAPALRALAPPAPKSCSQSSLLWSAGVACPAEQGTCLKTYCISRECNLLSLINSDFGFCTSSVLGFVI